MDTVLKSSEDAAYNYVPNLEIVTPEKRVYSKL